MAQRSRHPEVFSVRPRERRARHFLNDESGQAATEYILIIGLLCIVIAVSFNRIHESLRGMMERIVGSLNGPGI